MIDTISGSTFIGYFEGQKKWHKCDDGIGKCKNIYLDNNAVIHVTYYPNGYLTISFSAPKIQKGNNAIAYDFENYILVEDVIVKTKTIHPKPMDLEEAIMQMELIGHSFFVYTDVETNQIAIVYKRHDGDYGLIEMK